VKGVGEVLINMIQRQVHAQRADRTFDEGPSRRDNAGQPSGYVNCQGFLGGMGPGLLGFEEVVQDDEEFAHAGGDSDFEGFAG
jgi:hypothetical protein